MAAIEKTKALLRLDLPIGAPGEEREEPEQDVEAGLRPPGDNLEQTGLTDPILARPLDLEKMKKVPTMRRVKGRRPRRRSFETQGCKFRIVGGHHRFDAAAYIGFDDRRR